MPTSDSSTHAANAHECLRDLAHSTLHITDPGEIYDLLGDISLSMNSLSQALHQIARVHDQLEPGRARVAESTRSGRATSCAVSWEIHRAAEMLTQVAAGIDRAHQDEARISYTPPDPLLATPPGSPSASTNGLHR